MGKNRQAKEKRRLKRKAKAIDMRRNPGNYQYRTPDGHKPIVKQMTLEELMALENANKPLRLP